MSSSQFHWYQFMRDRTSIKSYWRWQMSRISQYRVHVLIQPDAGRPAIYQLYIHLRESDLAAADRIYFMVLLQSITRCRRGVIDLSTRSASSGGQSVHLGASKPQPAVLGSYTCIHLLWSVHVWCWTAGEDARQLNTAQRRARCETSSWCDAD